MAGFAHTPLPLARSGPRPGSRPLVCCVCFSCLLSLFSLGTRIVQREPRLGVPARSGSETRLALLRVSLTPKRQKSKFDREKAVETVASKHPSCFLATGGRNNNVVRAGSDQLITNRFPHGVIIIQYQDDLF